jgi:hypothetical protein
MSIGRTYDKIRQLPSGYVPDSMEVVKEVEKYRQFWKPRRKTNVILLAESHVYTNNQDFEINLDRSKIRVVANSVVDFEGYPHRFVRFVYCLGYGENGLLSHKPKGNAGTWQFWKIFSSCVADSKHKLNNDFKRILKTGTPDSEERLRNKVEILRKMREDMGIWLVDASIVGLYGTESKLSGRQKERIIRSSWDDHIADVVGESQPRHIIIVGKGVCRVLWNEPEIKKVGLTVIDQPQARVDSVTQLRNYQKYQEVCHEYA